MLRKRNNNTLQYRVDNLRIRYISKIPTTKNAMFATRGGVSYKSVTQKLYFIVAVWALGRRQEDWV